jgi:hypothetical protein
MTLRIFTSESSMPDLVDLSHRRRVLAALVVSTVPEDTLTTVKTKYNTGRFSPLDAGLEIIQTPQLLTSSPDKRESYVREQFALNPESPIIPCWYIVIDERTSQDGSVLFVQQDWPLDPDNSLRTMPKHVYCLFMGFLMGSDDWERCQQEYHNDDDVYNPPEDIQSPPNVQAVVRFPVRFAHLVGEESEDVRIYELDLENAQLLGLSLGDRPRTVKQRRRAEGTFGDHLFLEVWKSEIVSASDVVRIWDNSDVFEWGKDSEA